jgi:hypothetical protein
MDTRRFATGVVVLFVVGCGGPKLVDVTGKLTHRGKPVPSTRVAFYPDDGSRKSSGVTDDEGKFHLKYSRTQSGTTRGKHTVCLTYVVGSEEELGKVQSKVSKETKTTLNAYSDPNKSPLHYDVESNGQVIDIDLK